MCINFFSFFILSSVFCLLSFYFLLFFPFSLGTDALSLLCSPLSLDFLFLRMVQLLMDEQITVALWQWRWRSSWSRTRMCRSELSRACEAAIEEPPYWLGLTDALLRDGWVAWLWLGSVGDFIDFDGNGLWWVWVCRRGCGGYGGLPWLRRCEWVVDLDCWSSCWGCGWSAPGVLMDAVGLVGVWKKIYKKRIIL